MIQSCCKKQNGRNYLLKVDNYNLRISQLTNFIQKLNRLQF